MLEHLREAQKEPGTIGTRTPEKWNKTDDVWTQMFTPSLWLWLAGTVEEGSSSTELEWRPRLEKVRRFTETVLFNTGFNRLVIPTASCATTRCRAPANALANVHQAVRV